jgi:hypothetical protein
MGFLNCGEFRRIHGNCGELTTLCYISLPAFPGRINVASSSGQLGCPRSWARPARRVPMRFVSYPDTLSARESRSSGTSLSDARHSVIMRDAPNRLPFDDGPAVRIASRLPTAGENGPPTAAPGRLDVSVYPRRQCRPPPAYPVPGSVCGASPMKGKAFSFGVDQLN